jgi:hypothetical protein
VSPGIAKVKIALFNNWDWIMIMRCGWKLDPLVDMKKSAIILFLNTFGISSLWRKKLTKNMRMKEVEEM